MDLFSRSKTRTRLYVAQPDFNALESDFLLAFSQNLCFAAWCPATFVPAEGKLRFVQQDWIRAGPHHRFSRSSRVPLRSLLLSGALAFAVAGLVQQMTGPIPEDHSVPPPIPKRNVTSDSINSYDFFQPLALCTFRLFPRWGGLS